MNNEDIRALEDLIERVLRKVLKEVFHMTTIHPSSYSRSLDARGLETGSKTGKIEHDK